MSCLTCVNDSGALQAQILFAQVNLIFVACDDCRNLENAKGAPIHRAAQHNGGNFVAVASWWLADLA